VNRSKIKYLLALLAIASLIGSPLLAFSLPVTSERLIEIYLVCLVGLFVSFIRAAFRRRWADVGILVVIWPLVLFPFYGPTAPLRWIYVEAFRIHASPIDAYLSRCKLIEFVESGTRQMLGRCDILVMTGEYAREVFYDTTGEFGLPIAQRTAEWEAAMGHFSPRAVFLEKEGRAEKLFGNFYEIQLSPLEGDGSDDDPF
jgi:hypothetical protein